MAFFTADFAASAMEGVALRPDWPDWTTVAGFLTTSYDAPREIADNESAAKRRFIQSSGGLEILYLLKIRSSDMKSIWGAQS